MKFIIVLTVFTCANLFSTAQNIGIGTLNPDSKLHVASVAADSVALKVSVNNNTKLKVASNGGVSVGTPETATADGFLVKAKAIVITSAADSVVLQAGTTTIVLSATGAVRIVAGNSAGITIDGGSGDVTIKGANVNINSTNGSNITGSTVALNGSAGGSFQTNGNLSFNSNNLIATSVSNTTITATNNLLAQATGNATLTSVAGTAKLSGQAGLITSTAAMNINGNTVNVTGSSTATLSGNITTVQGNGQANVTGAVVHLGSSSAGFPAARQGDLVVAPGGSGTIVTGSPTVLIQ